MAGHQDVWRTEPDGVLTAEVDSYRLVVQAPERTGGSVRFLRLRRDEEEAALALIGSGHESGVAAFIKTALASISLLLIVLLVVHLLLRVVGI